MPKSIEQHARHIDRKARQRYHLRSRRGSGAFPVGMMTEIVRARSALTPYFNDVHERTPYYFKRHAFKTCLYGVDIDAGAVEIASCVFGFVSSGRAGCKASQPVAESRLQDCQRKFPLRLPFKSHGLLALEEIKRKFFDETDHDRKAALKTQIDEQIQGLLAASEKSLGYRVQFDLVGTSSEVFEEDRSGFDIVIGNRLTSMSNCLEGGQELLRQCVPDIFTRVRCFWFVSSS